MAYKKLATTGGVELAYTDNGVPSPYTTIIAIHGMCFCAPVFKKAQAAAQEKGVRFIAINRRNYPGSTPYSPEDVHALNKGTEEEKDAYLKSRAHEIATFIDAFTQQNNIPPISENGRSGGIVLLGWSVGAAEANATIAHADTLDPGIRSRLSSYIRALVLYEPGSRILGLPNPPKDWSPYLADCLSPELRGKAFAQWVTAYFDHGDLSTRDPDVLSYILPSTYRPGSIYNMSKSEQEEIIFLGEESSFEGAYFLGFDEQRYAVYRKAVFAEPTAELFPRMRISQIVGDKSPSFAIAGYWAMKKDAENLGRLSVDFKIVPGINHFVHWDEPERSVDIFLECAGINH